MGASKGGTRVCVVGVASYGALYGVVAVVASVGLICARGKNTRRELRVVCVL